MKTVYIVLDTQAGWDCIVGVYDTSKVTKKYLEESFPKSQMYVVLEKYVE